VGDLDQAGIGREGQALGEDVRGWLGDAFVTGHACSFADRAKAVNPFGLCRTGF